MCTDKLCSELLGLKNWNRQQQVCLLQQKLV